MTGQTLHSRMYGLDEEKLFKDIRTGGYDGSIQMVLDGKVTILTSKRGIFTLNVFDREET